MTRAELVDLFLSMLVRRGGTRRQWRISIGDVQLYDRATHPHCNWSIAPSGTIVQIETIELIADDLRLRHPVVTA